MAKKPVAKGADAAAVLAEALKTKRAEIESQKTVAPTSVKEPEPEKTKDPILSARIIQVRVYQAVSFDGGTLTTFMIEGNASQRLKPVSVRIIPELLSVEIKNDRDQVLVPLTNVSGIYFESARYKKRKAEEKADADLKSGNSAALVDETKKPR